MRRRRRAPTTGRRCSGPFGSSPATIDQCRATSTISPAATGPRSASDRRRRPVQHEAARSAMCPRRSRWRRARGRRRRRRPSVPPPGPTAACLRPRRAVLRPSSPTSRPARWRSNVWPSTAPPRSSACPSARQAGDAQLDRVADPVGDRRCRAGAGRAPRWRRCSVSSRMKSGLPFVASLTASISVVGHLRAGDIGHQLGEFGAAEPGDLETGDRAVPAQFGERCARRRRHVGRPNRAHDHHVREVLVRRQERQQRQGARIGPVEIVEHSSVGPVEPSSVPTVSNRRRRSTAGSDRLGTRISAPASIRPGTSRPRSRRFAGTPSPNRPSSGAYRLDERLEHAELLGCRSPGEHGDAAFGEVGRELLGQRALAHSRFTEQQRHPGATCPGVVQRLQLRVASDERAMGAPSSNGGRQIVVADYRRRSPNRARRGIGPGGRGDQRGALFGDRRRERIAEEADGVQARRLAPTGLQRGNAGGADPGAFGEPLLGEPG